ncbi:MAG TPA: ferredoxin reductase family protein, partial [Micromonosporaceae bacterium]|nr:ferredoxin reductase family protein [Micromonosporaceae bacterium]
EWPDQPEPSDHVERRPVTAPNPANPAIRRRTLLLVLAIGLVTIIGFWWHQTSASEVGDTAGELTAGGRLAGLVGGYLLLVQVLLMSRVPIIDRASSGARQSRWHRDLGVYVVIVVAAHVALITLGYAASSKVGVWHEVWTLLTTYQDLISATIAFGILVTISLLAMRSIRRRMPYGLWHLVHASAYVILLLAYGHQFADGQEFVLNHAAHTFWIAAYVIVIAALAYGRIVVPLWLNARHQLRVKSVVTEVAGVVSVYVTGRHLDRLKATAGQYVHWRFLTRDGWWRSHPYSLSAGPRPDALRLTVKAVGDQSRTMAALTPGTRVWIEAPTGEFTADQAYRPAALLIGAGSGIAPIRALMETFPPGTVVLCRARTLEDLIFKNELDRLAVERGMQVWYVLGRRDDPDPAHVFTPAGLLELVADIRDRDVYVCGPQGLGDLVVRTLAELDVPARQIHVDQFEL